jgi:hypothetical protein
VIDRNQSMDRIPTQMWIQWAIFSAAPIFLFFIAEQLTVNRTAPPSLYFRPVSTACIILSILVIIASLILYRKLPRWLLKPKRNSRTGLLNHLFEKGKAQGDKVQELGASIAASSTMIILYSFSQSCAVYGMVVVILGGDLWMMAPFVAVALLLQMVFRPTKALFRRIEEKFGTKQPGDAK